jgi:soluble lytic murein transglycosylase-like protein
MCARLLVFVSAFCLLAAPSGAEIVRLTNGRSLTVDACRMDGELAILLMPGGGEIRLAKAFIAELLPDEVPFARTAALEALTHSPAATRRKFPVREMVALVDRMAAAVGLDAKLAHAVVRVESNYNPLAISPRGAMGLMQVMPALAGQYGLQDPFDPEANLEAGLRHLRYLTRRFDIRRALAAYNAGETAVARYGGVPPYRETQSYVRRVLAYLQ